MLDQLELRRLLSSSLSGSILNIAGTDSANVVNVSISSGKIKVAESGLADKYYMPASITKIIAKLKGGNDKITISPSVTKNCELQGGGGKDTLRGGGGTDALLGQDGDDNLEGGAKNDYLDGGPGFDTADYSSRSSKVTAHVSLTYDVDSFKICGGGGGAGEADTYSYVEGLVGGSGNDTLASGGTDSAHLKAAFSLDGKGGDDYLEVGGDHTYGIYADSATMIRCTIHGGEGNDQLIYSGNVDSYFYGDNGNDTFMRGSDEYNLLPHVVEGGAGFDHLHCSNASGEGDGLIKITMHSTLESISVFNSNGGPIEVIGNDSANTIEAGHWEGLGNVTIRGAGGNDTLKVYYDPEEPYAVGVKSAYIQGGPGNDTILGCDKGDTIDAGDGNDRIESYAGNDSILAGAGNDTVVAGTGNDTIFGGDGNDALGGDAGNDSIRGGNGNDTLVGGIGRDKLFGEAGSDRFYSQDGAIDTLDGGSGFDSIALKDAQDVLVNIP